MKRIELVMCLGLAALCWGLSGDFVKLLWQSARSGAPVVPAVFYAIAVHSSAASILVFTAADTERRRNLFDVLVGTLAAVLSAGLIHEVHYWAFQAGMSLPSTLFLAMLVASVSLAIVYAAFGVAVSIFAACAFVIVYLLAARLQGGAYTLEELARTPVGTLLCLFVLSAVISTFRKRMRARHT